MMSTVLTTFEWRWQAPSSWLAQQCAAPSRVSIWRGRRPIALLALLSFYRFVKTNPPHSWGSTLPDWLCPSFLKWPCVASGLFPMCRWRARSVHLIKVSYSLLGSQEEDSSLVSWPGFPVGPEIKGRRRSNIFPISEPQFSYCPLSKSKGLSQGKQKACRLRSNRWTLGKGLEMPCWSYIIARTIILPLAKNSN